jgi:hypothetical protein
MVNHAQAEITKLQPLADGVDKGVERSSNSDSVV